MELQILDVETALARIENDRVLFAQIVEIYIAEAPKHLSEIRTAISSDERKVIERHAHSLKSASANVGAERVRKAASVLEDQAHLENLAGIKQLAQQIETEIALALGALKNFQSP